VIGLEVPDDRLDCLAAFEQSALFVGQSLVFAPVFDLDVRVVLIHTPVAQVGIDHLRPDAQALHQDRALFDLLVHGMPVIRIAGKASGAHDQVALERHGQAHLHAKLVGVATLALGDALDLRGMPAVELGPVAHRLAATSLCHQPFGLVQGMTQHLLHGQAEHAHLAVHFPLQPTDDGALAFDDFAHPSKLTGMGIATRLETKLTSFLGIGLLELNAMGLGRIDHLGSGCLQKLAVGGMRHGLFLNGRVHDHAGQLLAGNELEGHRHL